MNDNLNKQGWAERLKQYNCVQPGMLDKEASWEVLRARLYPKPKRKKTSWYYWAAAAAAAVIVLLLFIGLNDHHKQGNTVSPVVKKAPLMIKENQTILPVKSDREKIDPVVKTLKPERNKHVNDKINSLQPMVDKKPLPFFQQDSTDAIARDRAATGDFVQQPAPLPRVNIYDITTKDSFKGNMNLQKLKVQRLIRLFNTDMTKDEPSNNNDPLPDSRDKASDNQN